MPSIPIRRAVEICRDDGLLATALRSFDFARWQVKCWYSRWRGEYAFTFGDNESVTRMLAASSTEIEELEIAYRSERQVTQAIIGEIRPNDVFWDVGANVGYYSCGVAESSTNVRVIAFEPNPVAVDVLKRNLQLNESSNVEIQEIALADSTGKSRFGPVEVNNPTGVAGLTTDNGDDYIQIQIATGDSLVKGGTVPSPDVIKIDVEGVEEQVLKGCEDILEECRAVFCEIHGATNVTDEQAQPVVQRLESYGFSVQMVQHRDDDCHIKATRTLDS